ncbi:tRNA (adenosine(37)-N6)-threonylcarbamoyltransferase complex transferase subunit TsaD [Gracilinema caldarium]|uniref:tRNA (adenosine(37)-N6)-threonylcarbamoyltransferase complex transferase subunit TsaD n=1 Tax=Gracilinema caldarium TaxID=215591 RepID=UPI0026F30A1A|nr:tRNA (adenosine(37)-N6)-threonylcarbamoyltransferase complex transferase subunit TsaD [Gracilinema caldarium]
MKVLGIESSCDECAAAVVEDGKKILSNVVATQIPFHEIYNGVVPEIASRMHTEWISGVVKTALSDAGCRPEDIDAVSATAQPGLLGSLLVGLSFGKAFAYSLDKPFIAVDHMLAHLYAPMLSEQVDYPFLGLLVSGGHSIICRVDDFDSITVLGTTIDDAVGEAFDKVAKFYGFGYPGGVYIDRHAKRGDSNAFKFPMPNLYKGEHRYDVSYSGLKTAVINQIEQFRQLDEQGQPAAMSPENIAASFQKTAIDILLRSLYRAVEDTGLTTVVAGGGVAANSYLRHCLVERHDLRCLFPPLDLCGDNGAMVAGLGYKYLDRGDRSPWTVTASARVKAFKRRYP